MGHPATALAPLAGQGHQFRLEDLCAAAVIDDSRLVIASTRTPAVLVLNFLTGDSTTLGRSGEGPGEYRMPFGVAMLFDGRIAALDAMSLSVATWTPDGRRPDRWLRGGLAQATLDGFGNTVGEAYSLIGTSTEIDRTLLGVPLLRIRKSGGVPDTVTLLQRVRPIRVGPIPVIIPLFAPADHWGVARDGTVWVASGTRHLVEWCRLGTDSWIRSAMLHIEEPPTTTRDRVPLQVELSIPDPAIRNLAHPLWPTKAAFAEAVGSPIGEVWVRLRWPVPDHRGEAWAVFQPVQGRPARMVRLPVGVRLVAVGDRHLFLGEDDESGIVTVRKVMKP